MISFLVAFLAVGGQCGCRRLFSFYHRQNSESMFWTLLCRQKKLILDLIGNVCVRGGRKYGNYLMTEVGNVDQRRIEVELSSCRLAISKDLDIFDDLVKATNLNAS